MTSPFSTTSSNESTTDSNSEPLALPVPTAQIDQTTIQMIFGLVMAGISLGLHLWEKYHPPR